MHKKSIEVAIDLTTQQHDECCRSSLSVLIEKGLGESQ